MSRVDGLSARAQKWALGRVRKYYPDVKVVVDSPNPARIIVRNSDARSATKKAPHDCAMARACARQLKADGAIIKTTVAYVIRGKQATRYLVGEAVAREIVSFDRHHDFRPGVYQLGRVRKAQRLGTKRPRWHGKIRRGRHKPARVIHRTLGIRA